MDTMNGLNNEFDDLPKSKDGWNDVTEENYTNTRKDSFKIYQLGGYGYLLHVFSAGEYDGVEWYHTIFEDFKNTKPNQNQYYPLGKYEILTKTDILKKFNIRLVNI